MPDHGAPDHLADDADPAEWAELSAGSAWARCASAARRMGAAPRRERRNRFAAPRRRQRVTFIDNRRFLWAGCQRDTDRQALYPTRPGLVIASKGGFTRPGPGSWAVDCGPRICGGSARRA